MGRDFCLKTFSLCILQAGRAALPQLMLKSTAPALCYLCSLCSYVSRAKRHKGEQPLSLINKKAIAKNATA